MSEADIAAGSGVGLPFVRTELYRLMRRYACTLDVRDDGAIVYDFGRRLRRIDAPTWRERAGSLAHLLWRGFKRAYRVSLGGVLLVYTVVFSPIILPMVLQTVNKSDDLDFSDVSRGLRSLFASMFEATTHTDVVVTSLDAQGYPHAKYQPSQPALPKATAREGEKSFVAAVFDFVFGPERVPVCDGAQTREVAAFVRARNGVLTVADVQALSGLARGEAQQFFARFVGQFEGEALITPQGLLVAMFPALLEMASSEFDEPVQMFWDEYEPPHEQSGNTAQMNFVVSVLASFNLFCAIGAESIFRGSTFGIWFGVVPIVVFSLFFAIPALRWFMVRRANLAQQAANKRKRIFRQLFEAREDSVPLASILQRANVAATTEAVLELEAMHAVLERGVRDVGQLEGDQGKGLVADTRLVYEEQRAHRLVHEEQRAHRQILTHAKPDRG